MELPTAWRELVAQVNGITEFGLAGMRDPGAPCASFDPVENIDWTGLYVRAPGHGRCDSDGHYLCRGCSHLSLETACEILGLSEEAFEFVRGRR